MEVTDMNEINLDSLLSGVYAEISKHFSNEITLKHYRTILRNTRHLHEKTIVLKYSEEIMLQHEAELKEKSFLSKNAKYVYRKFRQIAAIIREYIETGELGLKKILPHKESTLLPVFEQLVDEFRNSELQNKNKSAGTIEWITGIAVQFFEFAQRKFEQPNDITLACVSDFLSVTAPTHPRGMQHVTYCLRQILSFLNRNGYTLTNLSAAVPTIPKRNKRIMPAFTEDEIRTMLSAFDRHTDIGKRDFAMAMLAASTGLRSCDITKMRLQDIDWNNAEINLTQSKTQVAITLPLETNAGNAVVDYILHGRPKTDLDRIFLTHREPYRPVGRSLLGQRIVETCPAVAGPGKRAHSVRRYVATKLLAESVPAPKIREILGHTQKNSLRSYIRLETKGLAECALSFGGIEVVSEVYR
jgi:integrase